MVRYNRLLVVTFFACLFIMLQLNVHVSSYTEENGLEKDDSGTFLYDLYVDGELYQSPEDPVELLVSPNALLVKFYDNVLGMKVGESRSFYLTANDGYTDSSHDLFGKDLDYRNVKLVEITTNVQPQGEPQGESDGDSSPFFLNEFFIIAIVIIALLGGIVFLIIGLRILVQSTLFTGKLSSCSACGKKKEGECVKCGTSFCKKCFYPKCSGCSSNRFKPS